MPESAGDSLTMTSQVAAKLSELKDAGRPALIGYLPIGFPSLSRSVQAVKTMMDGGVDIVELGIPYTDPVMDGPVIQQAGTAALEAGVHVRDVFDVIRELRAYRPDIPILVMTYYNLVLKYGVDEFAQELAKAGGAGLIIPDLIPDEAAKWLAASDEFDLDRVFLVAPSSTPQRLALTAEASRGFVYAASTMGVTGARSEVGEQAERLVADTRSAGAEHVCVGLGVSTGEQAAQVGRYADGVIVGSALVNPLLGSQAGSASPTGIPDRVPDAIWQQRLAELSKLTSELAAGVAAARKAQR